MSVSKHEEKMIVLQQQLKENQLELHDYLSDLDSWTSDIAAKDRELGKKQLVEEPKLPPVRNSLDKKKRKKVKKKAAENGHHSEKNAKRISSYDYSAWDKFDVDKACDEAEKSSSEYETDEEWELERRKHLAESEKETGNEFFKKGKYQEAVDSYTRGIELDPVNAILPANRAMALLKQNKYPEAEVDCTVALTLDPLYIKAYLRRASSRLGQHKLEEALSDYNKVLTLEPNNKHAKTEITRIEKELSNSKERKHDISSFVSSEKGVVRPVYKPPEQRSKKPLRRLIIEEIGRGKDVKKISPCVKDSGDSASTKHGKENEKNTFLNEKSATENQPVCVKDNSTRKVDDSANNKTVISQQNGLSTTSESKLKQPTHTEQVKMEVCDSGMTNDGIQNASENKNDSQKQPVKGERLKSENRGSVNKGSNSQKGLVQDYSSVIKDVPQTSFQFQTTYKIVKNNPEALYNYFKNIEPSSLSKLFGQAIDADIIVKIFMLFNDFFIPNGLDILPYVKHISEVPRFDVAVMFLSAKEKQVFREVFDHLRKNPKICDNELDTLAKKYLLS